MSKKIKYLVMDVDGTLTDGKIYMGNGGEVMKVFDIKDGCGIHDILPKYGIVPVVITARESQIVSRRCEELGIADVYQGERNKLVCLKRVLGSNNDSMENVAFIGDDIIDLPCIKSVKAAGGVCGCPSDAAMQVRTLADYICSQKGGQGAVREFIEFICEERNTLSED